MRRASISLIVFVVCIGAFSIADLQADNTYEFRFSQDNYGASTAGELVNATVFLRETATNSDVARLAPGDPRAGEEGDGLFSFGLNVSFNSVSGATPGSTIPTNNDINLEPRFFFFTGRNDEVVVRSGDADFQGTEDFSGSNPDGENGVTGTLVSTSGTTTVYEIELATLSFIAGAAGSTTNLVLADNTDGAAANSLFADFTIIDGAATYGSASIVVANVPEPNSLLLIGGLMVGGLLRRKRKD